MKSLSETTAQLAQQFELLLGLDPFCDNFEAEAIRHRDNRAQERNTARVFRRIVNERAIDLKHVKRVVAQIAQR